METTKLCSKGSIIVPKGIRENKNWEPGTKFLVEENREGILLRPLSPLQRTRIEDLMDCVNYKGLSRNLEEMNEAISREAKRHK